MRPDDDAARVGSPVGWACGAVYRVLLLAYPRDFRAQHGDEAAQVFAEACGESWSRGGTWAVLRRLAAALIDVPRSGVAERRSAVRARRIHARPGDPFSAIAGDFRHALRSVVQSRGVAALSILCLALGIGVVTTVFAVVNGVLLQPVPFRDPDRLLQVTEASTGTVDASGPVSASNFDAWRRQPLAAELAAMRQLNVTTTRSGVAERHAAVAVTANMFGVLGLTPVAGRAFRADEDRPGTEAMVLIGEALWQSEFGADPAAVGKQLLVEGRPATIVGVVPRLTHPGLPGAWRSAGIWLPLGSLDRVTVDDGSVSVFARVSREKDPVRVAAGLETELAALNAALPASRDRIVRVAPVDLSVSPTTRSMLLTISGAAVFVLLIACTNVANLLLLRSTARQREMATRLALGASRARIVRQLFLESTAIGLASVPAGLFLGWLGRNWLLGGNLAQANATLPIDVRVVLAATAVALLTSVLFGLAPALQSMRVPMRAILGDGGREATAGRSAHRLRLAFATGEIALSLVLLVSAALLARSFANLLDADRDLDLSRVVVVGLGSPEERRESPEDAARATDAILALAGGLAPVQSAALSEFMPLRNSGPRLSAYPEEAPPDAPERAVRRSGVSPRFFEAMGIAFDAGRPFTSAEARADASVVVVNRRMADLLWPRQDAVGKRLRLGTKAAALSTVVGVSRNISNWDINGRPLPTAYVPLSQASQGRRVLVVRTSGDGATAMAMIGDVVASSDRTPRGAQPMLLETVSRDAFFRQRTLMTLFGVFSVFSLLLTTVGLYGVLSYFVSQRRREFGIRSALGASRGDLIWLVSRQTLLVAGAGIAIGMLVAVGATRVLQSVLFEVRATDPISFNATAIFLIVVIALASWMPAYRASSTDPTVSLRD